MTLQSETGDMSPDEPRRDRVWMKNLLPYGRSLIRYQNVRDPLCGTADAQRSHVQASKEKHQKDPENPQK